MLTEDILNTFEVEGVEVPTNEQPDRDEEPLYTGCLQKVGVATLLPVVFL